MDFPTASDMKKLTDRSLSIEPFLEQLYNAMLKTSNYYVTISISKEDEKIVESVCKFLRKRGYTCTYKIGGYDIRNDWYDGYIKVNWSCGF